MRPRAWVLVLASVFLFSIWSNSFIAISYLLGGDGAQARLDWIGLTVARFVTAAPLCGAYLLIFRRGESLDVLRGHWRRLVVCGLLAVPGYNLALCFGQQRGVPAPIASLTTTLVPLFVASLAAIFLHERLTRRRVAGFLLAATGMAVVALTKKTTIAGNYGWLVAVTALAPLCWSVYSVVSKPMTGRVSPVVWTYLTTAVGGAMLVPALPGPVWRQLAGLDVAGWAATLYLSVPCTVLGYALWTWLLRFLPATTVGFTVFLNPPLTTMSKLVLSALLPATFFFTILPQEWLGGALTLLGMGIAVRAPRHQISGTRR